MTAEPARDPKVDWVAIEHLVDDAIRREAITTSRGAEILGIGLRTWRDRSLEIRDEGNPLALPAPAHPHDGYAYDDCKCVCCVNIRALDISTQPSM